MCDFTTKQLVQEALDEHEYDGKTLRQWLDILKDYIDKKSTLERILENLERELSLYKNKEFDTLIGIGIRGGLNVAINHVKVEMS